MIMALLSSFSRICSQGRMLATRSLHTTASLNIQVSQMLLAEPLKKKKKIDPQVLKQREERRRKKLEKQIRRLEKNARQLKPVDELEVPLDLIDQQKKRERPQLQISSEILEERALLQKEWARYKLKAKIADFQTIDKVFQAQKKALEELRKESEILYQEAIQPDLTLMPFKTNGPVATPPIENYKSPDGEYLDISKKWE